MYYCELSDISVNVIGPQDLLTWFDVYWRFLDVKTPSTLVEWTPNETEGGNVHTDFAYEAATVSTSTPPASHLCNLNLKLNLLPYKEVSHSNKPGKSNKLCHELIR